MLSLCSGFQIITEKRVIVFWNLIWLLFLRDSYMLVHYCQLKSQLFFFQGIFKECYRSDNIFSCQYLLCWRSSITRFFSFHLLRTLTELGNIRILPVLQGFSCPAEEITLLVCLHSSGGIPTQPCMSEFFEEYKQAWVDYHVSPVSISGATSFLAI